MGFSKEKALAARLYCIEKGIHPTDEQRSLNTALEFLNNGSPEDEQKDISGLQGIRVGKILIVLR